MNFDFSDDAKTLRDQARRFLSERAGPASARRAMDGAGDGGLAGEIAALGWPAARVPEAHGGLGLSAEEACVLAEELGRSLAPVPFLSTLAATEALLLAGSAAQQARWLPGIAGRSVVATVGWAEGGAGSPGEAALIAQRGHPHLTSPIEGGGTSPDMRQGRPLPFDGEGQGGVTTPGITLSGVKTPVPDLLSSDIALVTAATDDGPALFLVDLKTDGVAIADAPTLDLVRRHGRLTLDGAPAEPVGDAAAYQRWLDRAAVLSSWEAIGTASAAMEMAVAYAKERVAFGQAIGRYQGIKHKCADMYVKLELARAHAMHATWAMETDAPELAQSAAAARVAALDALRFAAEENVQIHGGIGFTWESDCQFYYRRNRQIAFALGPRGWWAERLVRSLERRNRRAA